MIRIFDSQAKTYSTNGIIAIDTYKVIETKKKSLNGWYIDVELPIEYLEYIKQDQLCVIKTKSKLKPQAFRIQNPKHTSRRISFTAHHVMFDAAGLFLKDVRPINVGALSVLNYVNERTDKASPFSYVSNASGFSTAYFIRKNLLEAWQVIEERWNGVFDADNFNISFNTGIPIESGIALNYGTDLQGVEVFEDWSAVATRLYPTGKDGVMLPEVYIDADVTYAQPYTKTVQFDSDLDEEEQTPENIISELRQKAIDYISTNKYPRVSYTVKSDVQQNLEIGHVVTVRHPYVLLKTQVLEYMYDVSSRRVKSIVFGNYSRDVKQKFDSIKSDIQQTRDKLTSVERTVTAQTELINSLNKFGFVYIDTNEILILDSLPKETAVNVWRFGLGGIGFSSSGYEGPFNYAFTQDGKFNASFVQAGSITTNHLSSDVGSSLDLSSNESVNVMVNSINNINQIVNPVGLSGIEGWTFISDPVKFQLPSAKFHDSYPFKFIDINGPIMDVVETDTAAGSGFLVWKSGIAISKKTPVINSTTYSLKLKVKGDGALEYRLRELNNVGEIIRERPFFAAPVSSNWKTVEGSLIVAENCTHIQLVIYSSVNVYGTRQLTVFSDSMLTRGSGQNYRLTSEDNLYFAKSQFEVLKQRIVLSVDANGNVALMEIGSDTSIGSYFKVRAENIQLEGIVTVDGNIQILEDGSIVVNKGTFKGKIETFEDVSVGTRISTPLLTPKNTTEAIRILKGERGGIHWGIELDESGNVTTPSKAAIFAYNAKELLGESNDAIRLVATVRGDNYGTNIGLSESGVGMNISRSNPSNIASSSIDIEQYEPDTLGQISFSLSSSNFDTDVTTWQMISFTQQYFASHQELPLGSLGYRWGTLFTTGNPNVSSDIRYKYDIHEIDPYLIECVAELEPKVFRTKFNNKLQFGYIAQDIERVLYKYCLKKFGRKFAYEKVSEFNVLSKSESYMSLVYGEIQVLVDAYHRKKEKSLEERIGKLEEIINGKN